MAQAPWQQVEAFLQGDLRQHGFEIVHAFPVQVFNAHSPSENQLPTFSRPHSTLAVIIGNTNSLWPPFLHHLAQSCEHELLIDPLDTYVEQHITTAVQQCCQHCAASLPSAHGKPPEQPDRQIKFRQHTSPFYDEPRGHHITQQQSIEESSQRQVQQMQHELRFSHHFGPKFVNMLRAAQLSGLAYYSTTTHLCIHPIYGPWFALRAVAIFDCEGPDPSCYSQLPCSHPDLEQQAGVAMKQLEELGGLANWQQHWKQWAELRSMGGRYTDPRYAYSPEQLEYHYTKSKAVLADAVNKQLFKHHCADQNDVDVEGQQQHAQQGPAVD